MTTNKNKTILKPAAQTDGKTKSERMTICPLEPRILLSVSAIDLDIDDPGENIEGTAANDKIEGTDGADSILGLGGSDLIRSGIGDDVIDGDGTGSPTKPVLSDNLLANGDFESGRSGYFRHGSAEGWDASHGWEILPASVYGRSNEGHNRVFELDAYQNTRIGQSVEGLEAGENLLLTLDAAQRTAKTTDTDGFEVYWNGDLVDRVDHLSDWRGFEYNLHAGSGDGSDRLEIQGIGRSNSYGTLIDNVSLRKFIAVETKTSPAGNDEIWSGEGDDVVHGNLGDDEIHGGDGEDKLFGDEGNDYIAGNAGRDEAYGGDGNDKIYGSSGSDKLFGENGNDRLSGGTGNDLANGGEGDDLIYGGDGNDKLYGENGDDRLYGSDGEDLLVGGAGNDRLSAGDGNDRVWSGEGDDFVYGGAGDDVIYGSDGNDRLSAGDGDDEVHGGRDNDEIYGSGGNDDVRGGSGDDDVSGGDGNDLVYGNAGDDELTGNAGHDEIHGGDGNDEIWGDTPGSIKLVAGTENLANEQVLELGPTVHEHEPTYEGLMDELLSAEELVKEDRGLLFAADGDFVIDAGETPTDLQLEFVGGQAGHRNIVGWYNIDAEGRPSNPQILKVMNSGIFGAAKDTSMGHIEGATGKIGFFILDNGASSKSILKAIDSGYEMQFADREGDGDIDALQFVNDSGRVKAQHRNVFFSTTAFNRDGHDHFVAGKDGDGNVVVGIEDLPNNGDNDFDDFVFKIVGHQSEKTFSFEQASTFDQTFNELESGDKIRLSFDVASRLDSTGSADGVSVYWNGELVHSATELTSAESLKIDLEAGTGDGSNRLEIRADGMGGNVTNLTVNKYSEVVVQSDDAGDDVLFGGYGNDEMHGNDGDDVLHGQQGDDYLAGNDGNDNLRGGSGNDTVYGGTGDDIMSGWTGNDRLSGGDGNDIASGGEGDDEIYGSQGEDDLRGGSGNDRIYGGTENDKLAGDGGNDRLSAGDGDDTLKGGEGNDLLIGGAGIDTAVFEGNAFNYRLSYNDEGRIVVRDYSGGEGTDTLISVEKLQFGDIVIDVDEIDDYMTAAAVTPSVAEDVWVDIPNSPVPREDRADGDGPATRPPAPSPETPPAPPTDSGGDTPEVSGESTGDVVVIENAPSDSPGNTNWQNVDFGQLTQIFPK